MPGDPPEPRCVLVVDDHPVVRRGLRALLADQPWVGDVVEAAGVAEAVRQAVVHSADVVAMDLQLPDGSGLEATERILRARPTAAVLVLTMTNDDDLVARALRAGARGYLVKDTDPDTVVAALYAVAHGAVILGPHVEATALTEPRDGEADLPPPLDQLSPREREVLAQLAAGRTNVQIAKQLGLSEKTVRNHLSSVFAKVQVTDRVQAALLARDAGLTA